MTRPDNSSCQASSYVMWQDQSRLDHFFLAALVCSYLGNGEDQNNTLVRCYDLTYACTVQAACWHHVVTGPVSGL